MRISRIRIVVLLFLVSGIFIQSEEQVLATCDWSGTWTTSVGWSITFVQSGFNVEGTFTPRSGRIEGMRLGSNLEGGWSHLPDHAPPNHAGSFDIDISPNCNTFSGQYRKGYAHHGNAWLPFSGSRSSAGTTHTPPPPPPPGHDPISDDDFNIVFGWIEGSGSINNQTVNHGSDFRIPCTHGRLGCEAEIEARDKAVAKARVACQQRTVDTLEMILGFDTDLLFDANTRELASFEELQATKLLYRISLQFAGKRCGVMGSAMKDRSVKAQQGSFDISIDLHEGMVRLNDLHGGPRIGIDTAPARIIVDGNSDVTVGFDPVSFTTLVAVRSGSATVDGGVTGTVKVSSGQMVSVEPSGPGPVQSISSSTPSPPSNRTVARSGSSLKDFDVNSNNVLDESEFFAMVDAWLAETISNELFFTGVDFWISQEQITAASLQPGTEKLSDAVAISNERKVLFRARPNEVSRVQVEIFDMNGSLIFSGKSTGNKLFWHPNIANGVYFYRLRAISWDATISQSEVRKLIVMR